MAFQKFSKSILTEYLFKKYLLKSKDSQNLSSSLKDTKKLRALAGWNQQLLTFAPNNPIFPSEGP